MCAVLNYRTLGSLLLFTSLATLVQQQKNFGEIQSWEQLIHAPIICLTENQNNESILCDTFCH